MNLRTALANIHRDPFWWRKVLRGGVLALSVFGAPWAAGLVVESYDMIRKGYPSPLPPGGDWPTRYLIGFFALLIDFAFYLLPALVAALMLFCIALVYTLGSGGAVLISLALVAGVVVLCYWLLLFALGVSAVGRLIYSAEGHVEAAISTSTLREAASPAKRSYFIRARLQSLPAYLPTLLLGGLIWLVLRSALPGGLLLAVVLLWLALSALLYAHLVVAQLYGAASREQQRLG